jgi:galactokinase
MTVDSGIYIAVRARDDKTVRVASIRYDELVEYELDELEKPKSGSWSSYVLGVVEELRLRGHLAHGFEAVVDGNLHLGAGLSSSAALEVATGVSLQQIARFEMYPVDMVSCVSTLSTTTPTSCAASWTSSLAELADRAMLFCSTVVHSNMKTCRSNSVTTGSLL